MNTKSLSSRFEYRAAIALNNMAISMLERSCYNQAFATLQDAVSAVKLAVKPHRDCNDQQRVTKILEDANCRASRPDVSSRAIALTVVSHDAGPSSTDSPPQKLSTSATSVIRIETDDVDLLESEDYELTTAILLYNLGCAYLCLAHISDNSSLARKQQGAGMKLLKVSRSLLARQYNSCEDPFLMCYVVCLNILLLQTLVQASQSSRQLKEVNAYASALACFQKAARYLHDRCTFVHAAARPAAAA
jgi:hypothetical protein